METVKVTPKEMEARTARFDSLKPYSQQQEGENDIPPAAMERLTAHKVYPIMVPSDYTGRSALAPIKAGERTIVAIAECPPGNGPGLHNHETTIENFFCLQGRFKISWGDNGEDSIILEPMDYVSVPPGVCRDFKNISDELGRLFVVIEAGSSGTQDRVAYAPSVGEEITKDFGENTRAALEKIGFRFNAGQPENNLD